MRARFPMRPESTTPRWKGPRPKHPALWPRSPVIAYRDRIACSLSAPCGMNVSSLSLRYGLQLRCSSVRRYSELEAVSVSLLGHFAPLPRSFFERLLYVRLTRVLSGGLTLLRVGQILFGLRRDTLDHSTETMTGADSRSCWVLAPIA